MFRDYIENPKKRNREHLKKMWDVLSDITEFKELIARERMQALQGKKTYIVAALAGAAVAANVLGFIDDDTKNTILGFLAALGGATVAAKMNRQEKVTVAKINNLAQVNALMSNPLAIPTKPGFASAGASQSPHTDPTKKRY